MLKALLLLVCMAHKSSILTPTDQRKVESAAIAQAALAAALRLAPDQASLALWCQVDPTTVSRWKTGKYPIDMVALLRARRVRSAVLEAMADVAKRLEEQYGSTTYS